MSTNAIEAIHVIDHNNEVLLSHTYLPSAPPLSSLLPLYTSHPSPRPSLIHLPTLKPPTTLFSLPSSSRGNALTFLSPTTSDVEPLFVLEFLHRLSDILSDFLGSPLLPQKITSNYDIVAQLLGEVVDGGLVATTEPNALRDVVAVEGWVGTFLSGLGLASSSPSLGPSRVGAGGGAAASSSFRPHLITGPSSSISSSAGLSSATINTAGPAIPWRRSNVRHTSNECYVDIVETLTVILAPSGRPLCARAAGSILFTSKLSGVPDLVLTLSLPSGRRNVGKMLQLPTFHPCVRLNRWKESPGELSFIPPDGRFLLAGYEVDLLSSTSSSTSTSTSASWTTATLKNLPIPATVSISTSLGPAGLDFAAELSISLPTPAPPPSSTASARINTGSSRPGQSQSQSQGLGSSSSSFLGSLTVGGSNLSQPSTPALTDLCVSIPFPRAVRNVLDLRASKGEANFLSGSVNGGNGRGGGGGEVEWRLSAKEAGLGGTVVLRGSVVGPLSTGDEVEEVGDGDLGGFADGTVGVGGFEEYDPDAEDGVGVGGGSGGYQGPGEREVETVKGKKKKKKKKMVKKKKSKNVGAGDHDGMGMGMGMGIGGREEGIDGEGRDIKKIEGNKHLMPTSASVSFQVKGWLASGVRVDSLVVDAKRSRGLGEGVRPVKGAKYLCVSERGVEARC
ncbi:hypothetical protein MMC10_003152 [Thelotrema lepadinum]|nr:hypothetical protein [Thelotrema lepadinum]